MHSKFISVNELMHLALQCLDKDKQSCHTFQHIHNIFIQGYLFILCELFHYNFDKRFNFA